VLSSIGERAVAGRRLRAMLSDYATPGPSIYVVYPPQRAASQRLRVVIAFLRQVFANGVRARARR
jgi:DNA-binding transcriptional LysR family regulator